MEVNRRPSEVLEEQEIEQAIQSLHTQAELLRNDLEIQETLDFLRLGLRAKYLAIQRGDTCLLGKAERFYEFIGKCTTLTAAFRAAFGSRVAGPQGAAAHLGITMSALYARLDVLGFSSRDFTRAEDLSIGTLAAKEPFKSHIQELKEAMGKYKKADGGQHEMEGHTESV